MMNEELENRPQRRPREIEVTEDESFSYDGYEVVRGEFFAHTYEPMISFYKDRVFVNAACLRRFDDTEYIQILVNPEEKKLAVKPSIEEDKDSFKWATGKTKKIPRQIKCPIFFAKVFNLMKWNPDYKYRLLGKLIRANAQLLFVFDLASPEIFVRRSDIENGKVKISRKANYPEEWQNQFGLPAKDHKNTLNISLFEGYTVFGITNSESKTENKEGVSDDKQNQ